MTKSFFTVLGVVCVVVIAFWAGRWTAPVVDQRESTAVMSPVDNAHVSTESITAAPVNLSAVKPVAKRRSQSYAEDVHRLQELLALAASNPQLAMEKAQGFKGPIRVKAESAILNVWATNDPNGAWNWLQSFRSASTEQFIDVLEAIGRSEPGAALEYARTFADSHPQMRKDIYLAAITGITEAGAYKAATDFLANLDIEPAIKGELVNFVASSWGVYEPQAAMAWLSQQPEELRAAAASRLSDSWSDVDPQEATHFAAGSQSPESGPALQQSFSKWLATDSAAATAWLASEPNQASLDPLINEVATQPDLVNEQVSTALSWAARVNDPEIRLNTLTSILSNYKQRDPKAAAHYLQSITYLSDVERNRLREDLAIENNLP